MTVLHVEAGQWCYGRGCADGEPVGLLLTLVCFELACHYGDLRVWVEGHALSCRADHPPCRQLLVDMTAVRSALQRRAAS